MTVNNNKDISISKSSISSYHDRASGIYAIFAIKKRNMSSYIALKIPDDVIYDPNIHLVR